MIGRGEVGEGGGKAVNSRVEPRYNEPLYDEFLDVTNHFLYPSYSKIYGKESR